MVLSNIRTYPLNGNLVTEEEELGCGAQYIFGRSGDGLDVLWYSETPGAYMLFDESADALILSGISITAPVMTLANSGLHILDTNASHDLIITPGSDLTADRILTITTGDAARTITLSGDPTLADWFDQSVKAAASPTFTGATIGALLTTSLNLTGGETNFLIYENDILCYENEVLYYN